MPYQFTVPLTPQTASRPNWTPHGRTTRTFMPEKYRRWREDFDDWLIDFSAGTASALFYFLTHLQDGTRVFPIATRTADVDNYTSAVMDGIFESKPVKHYGLNDRWIQELHTTKRYTWFGSEEKPHIEVSIKRIERIDGLYT